MTEPTEERPEVNEESPRGKRFDGAMAIGMACVVLLALLIVLQTSC